MSGFTRDPRHYGDRLVYEALGSKWSRYHARCGCGRDWVNAHSEPAGFKVVREGSGFVALVGPGLTEDVDEDKLTTNSLWKAVTGTEGTQDWFETVHVFERPAPQDLDPDAERVRKAANDAVYAERRARSAAAKEEPLSDAQLSYLRSLVTKVSRERFDDDLTRAIKGSSVLPGKPDERTQQVIERLSRDVARKLISALKGER
jgi:hypothetical protein